MNLKAYLRGIGAGMIVAALVMGVSVPKKAKTAEPPIDKTTLKTSVSLSTSSSEKDDTSASVSASSVSVSSVSSLSSSTESSGSGTEDKTSVSSVSTEDNKGSTVSAGVESGNKEIPEEPENKENDTENKTDSSTETSVSKINPMPEGESGYTEEDGKVEIKIIKGDSSVSVSRRMFEAGLVESAAEFDKYLCANGYDKSISVGVYEIEYGLDFETMAKIITRRK